tara:strand:- start:60 stop:899 length:840 start_codon:yes stop_codon:yes gene_type:complete
MTGFSSKYIKYKNAILSAQIKSENSKNLEILIINEYNDFSLDNMIKKEIEKKFNRGKIKIAFNFDFIDESKELFEFKKYINDYKNFLSQKNINLTISLSELENLSKKQKRNSLKKPFIIKKVIKLMKDCSIELENKQMAEGKIIISAVNKKINKIESLKNLFHKKYDLYSKKLERKYLKELNNHIDSGTFNKKEISVFIEKIDIEEEIIRLDSHIKMIKKIISKKSSKNIGQVLDFYMQEINREANTLSSKSKDPTISNKTIEIKTLVNQIRELSANLS